MKFVDEEDVNYGDVVNVTADGEIDYDYVEDTSPFQYNQPLDFN